MTTCLRARVCYAGSLILTGGAIAVATSPYWPTALFLGYGAAFLAWCGRREAIDHRHALVAEQRAALTDRPAPCCLLWTISGGGDHGTDCTLGPGLVDHITRGWADLDSACCLRSWESHGHTHDTTHCTRTDQTA